MIDDDLTVHQGAASLDIAADLTRELERVLVGAQEAIHLAVVTLLAEGHLLIEDVPGVGKTTLARALARAIGGSQGRIQFTADLLPADITGSNVLRPGSAGFEFLPGPIFNNIVVADEINRASPKTQSALMECMQERQATVDGHTRAVPHPFMVIATQNPIEMDGTYPLPEAQRDRFMSRITVGYPDAAQELDMLERHESGEPVDKVNAVLSPTQLEELIFSVRAVHASVPIKEYIVNLARATRASSDVFLGASPRASLQLLAAAKANAAIDGRTAVIPDDIQAILQPVWAHRLVPSDSAVARGADMAATLAAVASRVPVGL